MEYCLIDCATTLVNGPFETLNEARARADVFSAWEIINGTGDLIDWSRELAQEATSPRTGHLVKGNTDGLACLLRCMIAGSNRKQSESRVAGQLAQDDGIK